MIPFVVTVTPDNVIVIDTRWPVPTWEPLLSQFACEAWERMTEGGIKVTR